MKKKALLTIAFISLLLLLTVVGTQLVNLGRANPFTNSQYSGQTGAPSSAKSPVVSIFSPKNDKEYSTNFITLTFNATVERFSEGGYNSPLIRGMRIDKSYYTADWLQSSTEIDLSSYLDTEEGPNTLSFSVNLTGIPEGKHVIRVFVFAQGTIFDPLKWYTFEKAGYSSVNFTIDTTPPSVLVFPIKNETYAESEVPEVPLNFTVNESASEMSYVLDGQDKVTITGNTTLAGLSEGEHNVTVYAIDNAGNVGASESIYFRIDVPETFPTTLVVATSVTVAVFGMGLLINFKTRRR